MQRLDQSLRLCDGLAWRAVAVVQQYLARFGRLHQISFWQRVIQHCIEYVA